MTSPPTSTSAVLVVEDSSLLLALLKDALRAHGVADVVLGFETAAELFADYERRLEHAEQARPHLLVIDIHLGGEDGLTLGRRLRELELDWESPPTPIVFFSSRPEDEEITAAVGECFPARYVRKADEQGPAAVALEGARLMRRMLIPRS